MIGYKAFDKGLICRGKQYKENTIFEEKEANICECGMHFCKRPLEVLEYYPLINCDCETSEFAEVESLAHAETDDNKKYVTTKLKINKKLSIKKLFELELDKTESWSIKKATIKGERISSLEDDLHILNKYSQAKIAISGTYVIIYSTGRVVQISSSGYKTMLCSSGDYAQISFSGDMARIYSSGMFDKISSSGDNVQLISEGQYAQICSSGDNVTICSLGDNATISSSGDYVMINSKGLNSVIVCEGQECMAKGKIGSWITLTEWEYDDKKEMHIPVCVKTEYIDGEKIKEDTFYSIKNRKFVKVKFDNIN